MVDRHSPPADGEVGFEVGNDLYPVEEDHLPHLNEWQDPAALPVFYGSNGHLQAERELLLGYHLVRAHVDWSHISCDYFIFIYHF